MLVALARVHGGSIDGMQRYAEGDSARLRLARTLVLPVLRLRDSRDPSRSGIHECQLAETPALERGDGVLGFTIYLLPSAAVIRFCLIRERLENLRRSPAPGHRNSGAAGFELIRRRACDVVLEKAAGTFLDSRGNAG